MIKRIKKSRASRRRPSQGDDVSVSGSVGTAKSSASTIDSSNISIMSSPTRNKVVVTPPDSPNFDDLSSSQMVETSLQYANKIMSGSNASLSSAGSEPSYSTVPMSTSPRLAISDSSQGFEVAEKGRSVEDLQQVVMDMKMKLEATHSSYLLERRRVQTKKDSLLKLANHLSIMAQELKKRDKKIAAIEQSKDELIGEIAQLKGNTEKALLVELSEKNAEIEKLELKMIDAEKQMMIVQSESDEVVVKITADPDGVKKELEDFQKEHDSRVADLSISSKKQCDELQSLIDEKDTKLEELSKEQNVLRSSFDSMKLKSEGDATKLMELMIAHAAELASTVKEHEKKVGILEASHSNECDDLEKRLMSVKKELSQFSTHARESNTLVTKHMADMTKKHADLQAALVKDAQLSEKLEKQENELVELRPRLASMTDEVSKYEKQTEELQRIISEMTKTHSESIAKLHTEYQSEKSIMELELKKTKQELEDLIIVGSRISDLNNKHLLKCERLEQAIGTKEAAIIKLRSDLATVEGDRKMDAKKYSTEEAKLEAHFIASLEEHQHRLIVLEGEKVDLEEVIAQLKDAQANQQGALYEQLAHKENDIDKLNSIIRILKDERTKSANQCKKANDDHGAEVARLEKQHEKETIQLKDEYALKCQGFEQELVEKSKELEKVQSDNRTHAARTMARLDKSSKDIENIKKKHKVDLDQTKKEFEAKFSKHKKLKEDYETTLNALNESLSKQCDTMEGNLEEKNAEVEKLNASVANIKRGQKELETQNAKMAEDYANELRALRKGHAGQIETLSMQLITQCKEFNERLSEKDEELNRLYLLESESVEQETAIARLSRGDVDRQKETIVLHRKEIEQLEKSHRETLSRLKLAHVEEGDALNRMLEKQTLELEELHDELAVTKNELEEEMSNQAELLLLLQHPPPLSRGVGTEDYSDKDRTGRKATWILVSIFLFAHAMLWLLNSNNPHVAMQKVTNDGYSRVPTSISRENSHQVKKIKVEPIKDAALTESIKSEAQSKSSTSHSGPTITSKPVTVLLKSKPIIEEFKPISVRTGRIFLESKDVEIEPKRVLVVSTELKPIVNDSPYVSNVETEAPAVQAFMSRALHIDLGGIPEVPDDAASIEADSPYAEFVDVFRLC